MIFNIFILHSIKKNNIYFINYLLNLFLINPSNPIGDMDTKVHQISTQRLSLNHEKKRCITETYSGHTGPVNVIIHSKMPSQPNFHGLMLTGSFDLKLDPLTS